MIRIIGVRICEMCAGISTMLKQQADMVLLDLLGKAKTKEEIILKCHDEPRGCLTKLPRQVRLAHFLNREAQRALQGY